ncbi:S41 family peptidase [Cohnella sp.]|uniref:S41 family peptidase n=1 Tax=Cohnella sp. TaxID=1883426 RepID=UPI00356AE378
MIRFKRWRLSLALILSLAIFSAWTPVVFGESTEQLQEVRDLLEKYHLSKPDDEDLSNEAIDGMVDSLDDPYTEYFDEEEWQIFNSALEQTFVGIGIVMSEDNGIVYIEDIIAGSPAESAGLVIGDSILSADDKDLTGKTVSEIQNEVRGVEGSNLVLGISRNGKTLKFNIERKSLHIPIVTTRMLGDGVGYLALSGFTSDAASQVKNRLAELEKEGLTSLVLDLRNNGGGYVTAAQDIAGLFIKDGVLAHMRDRDGNDNPLIVSGTAKPYSVVVLVNGNSASASELLAGALQDYGVAKIAGTNTFGKGVVQSLIPLQSGGMLKITIQEYYTPTGRKVDKVGLKPDIPLEGAAEQLIGAFRSVGGKIVSLTAGKGSLTVNGVRISQQDIIFKETNGWYINMRLAAYVLGAELKYDSKKRAVILTKGTIVKWIKTNDSRLKIVDGQSSIHAGVLKKWFSNVSYTVSGDSVKITVNE